MESKWRQNVADLEWSGSNWQLAARVLGFFPAQYVVRVAGETDLWLAGETFDPDQPKWALIQVGTNLTLMQLLALGLIEPD